MRALLSQLLRFASVGVLATVLHLAVAWIAVRGAGLAPLAGNACGFAAAFLCSYLGHFYWTFGQRDGHPVRLPRFLVASGIGFTMTTLITYLNERAGLPYEIALIVILAVVPLGTWALSRFWVFRD